MNFPLYNVNIKKIYAVNNINYTTRKQIVRTDRTLYSLAFKFSGKTVYVCDGQEYVSDNEHLLLIPKEKPYSFKIKELGACVMIEFESEIKIDAFYSYKITDSIKLNQLFTQLVHLWTIKSSGYELACLSIVYEILYKTHLADNTSYAVMKKNKILQPAISYIQTHYADGDLTNDLLAKIAGVSTVYFRKLFTERYHISPMKYIQNIRIETAKNLLLSDYHSISFIAESTGFSSVYTFSRAFKKETGVSPSEYSKNLPEEL